MGGCDDIRVSAECGCGDHVPRCMSMTTKKEKEKNETRPVHLLYEMTIFSRHDRERIMNPDEVPETNRRYRAVQGLEHH